MHFLLLSLCYTFLALLSMFILALGTAMVVELFPSTFQDSVISACEKLMLYCIIAVIVLGVFSAAVILAAHMLGGSSAH